MNEPDRTAPAARVPGRFGLAHAWIRRRNALISSALRGAAYSSGAGAVGLLSWWLRHAI
ncbi:hypothetical protein GCM10010269_15960 [Streptomyces humidus]|uniref:Uncharacterized protein n=1 Tax=Streptomyces humidus TaxID=52259 RepID=A0A918FSR8_9ACTN|nr:hypothetical protein [Streptomyces humidus]GGR77504.1 hypothetical protein GCM10010269_15960 [Streptomyces humidus]